MCFSCIPIAANAERRALTRSVFRRAAYPVWVLTSAIDGVPVGYTLTSVTSVSLAPPIVSFNISKSGSSLGALRGRGAAAVHLLDAAQRDLAARFASDAARRFADESSWAFDSDGLPEIKDTCARLVLRLRDFVDAGDSYVVLADVAEGAIGSAVPLLHHRGSFTPGDRLLGATFPDDRLLGATAPDERLRSRPHRQVEPV